MNVRSAPRGPVAVPVPVGGGSVAAALPASYRPPTGSSSGLLPMGMRPPTSSGLLPVGMRPPTGSQQQQRPASGLFRPPTGAAAAAGTHHASGSSPSPLSLADPSALSVSVSARPVTAAGLSGMVGKPASSGQSQRQVADKSYYTAEMKNRLTAISAEMEHLHGESVSVSQENAAYSGLERRYDSVMKEVRVLEGELADHNLAADKLRSNTQTEELKAQVERLREKNRQQRAETDEIFLLTGQSEARITQYQQVMNMLLAASKQQISVLGAEKVSEYEQLLEEAERWKKQRAEKQQRIVQLEEEMSTQSRIKDSAEYQLTSKCVSLSAACDSLLAQINECESDLRLSSDPQQLKDKLTERIKSLSEEVNQLEKQRASKEAAIEDESALVRELDQAKEDKAAYLLKESKYEAIYERDRKMSDFIAQFPVLSREYSERMQHTQKSIVLVMQQLSAESVRQSSLGDASASALSDMKDELSFKANKLKSSQETLSVLNKERIKRTEELEKIGQLDSKISEELKELKAKMAAMKEEIAAFKSEEEWKEFHQQEKKRLTTENNAAKKERDSLSVQNAQNRQVLLAAEKELTALASSSSLLQLEAQWQTAAKEGFEMEEFVNNRKKETEYTQVKKECLEIIQTINERLIFTEQTQ